MSKSYDLAVIGSGPGGYRAAILGSLRGLSVAIIEKADWGGCCLNRGCVPKKDWHHTAKLISAQKTFARRGIAGTLQGDMNTAWEHQKEVTTSVQESYVDYMKRLKVDALEGHARFVDASTLELEKADSSKEIINAKHTIIATGGAAYIPEPFTAEAGKVLTSDMLFDNPPPTGKRVAIIGSGVIATEFAYIFSMLGKEVTWLARSPMLRKIPYSPQAISTLKNALKENGVEAMQGAETDSVDTSGDGVKLTLKDGQTIEVDWVCLGTGRTPYTADLGLENIGVDTNSKGFINRNAYLQTSTENVYAIGDVASPDMTANHALSDATIAVDNIIDGNHKTQNPLWVPLVVYSATELARLGMDEDMAEDEELEPAVGFAAFETNPRAQGQDDTEGFVRLIGDMDSGALLGGEIVGSEAGEMIHLLSLAPDHETALKWLASGTYNHPARSEELMNATETLASKWGLADEIFGS